MATAYIDTALQEDLNVGTGTAEVRAPGGGVIVGTQIGIHSFGRGQARASASWDPGSIAVGAETSTTVTVTGAQLGDFVLASYSIDIQELTISASVSAADTVEVVLANNTSASVDLASGTVYVLVLPCA
jgi:hypothetical protein